MSDLTLGPRAQRAVILAHTGDFTAADAEMAQLEHYNLTPEQAEEIGSQRTLIKLLASQQGGL
ncbi:hypothetical protein [Streptomyces sp. NPDC051214]|uniref:hypothetical protein n=1 Tax=Streptomyces sp. NPDC051214 TaxID=3155282 RepID=UPI00342E0F27